MSRLPIPSVEAATGATRERFDALQQGLGMVPNMAKVMSHSPVVLRSWLEFNTALGHAALPAVIRERIALRTAERNGCAYCLSAHTALGGMVGLSPDEIDAARDGASSDTAADAALTFVDRVLETGGGIEARDLDAVRAAGFDDGQLAEIVAAIALNQFTNLFNRTFDVEIDFPRVEPRACTTC